MTRTSTTVVKVIEKVALDKTNIKGTKAEESKAIPDQSLDNIHSG